MTEQPNGWAALMAFFSMISAIGVIVGPILASRKAKEVKADLAVAKAEITTATTSNEAKLDRVHETVTKTEVLVNGDRRAKEERIARLEATLRAHGLDLP